MILFNGPNTPFGRLALATANELSIEVENRVINIFSAEAAFIDAHNPLRQIPTLLLDDGRACFDSRVIAAYFCSLRPQRQFDQGDWAMHTRLALAVGLMEAGVAKVMETLRPESDRNAALIAKSDRRIATTVPAFEADADAICDGPARIDRLGVAVALEYLDFRLKPDWRRVAPRLAAWLAEERDRPCLVSTRPRERDAALSAAGGQSQVSESPNSALKQ